MLKTLHIQNYRLFRDLTIDKLGQVNLIAGKNNSGKTALLEALLIYANEANVSVLSYILNERGEIILNAPQDGYSLFYNKSQKIISIKDDKNKAIQFTIESEYEKEYEVIRPFRHGLGYPEKDFLPIDKSIFVPFSIKKNFDDRLWENVSLTPKEDDVIEILRIIEPKIDKFRFDNTKAKILLKGQDLPIPLKRGGDGLNRLLSLALALVNAKGKMLLIDEFEVGLHYSIQEELWNIVFKYAQKWDIQVFATTHSEDTIRAFTVIGSKAEYKEMANYFRLQRTRNQQDIVAVVNDIQSLEIAINQDIEIR